VPRSRATENIEQESDRQEMAKIEGVPNSKPHSEGGNKSNKSEKSEKGEPSKS